MGGKRQLEGVEAYRILSQSSCIILDGVDDAAQFRGVQKAFDTIGIETDDQMQARGGRDTAPEANMFVLWLEFMLWDCSAVLPVVLCIIWKVVSAE